MRIVNRQLGCGAFGGDIETKSIIQWLAASQEVFQTLIFQVHYMGYKQYNIQFISRGIHIEFPGVSTIELSNVDLSLEDGT
ncbi:uncharacterized protein M6B38_141840 [Iris pallida]|uniref:PARG catalytic Macro domain-containing protein n=1 Tax=Iris pallida TaxID=29817 RepID=A0AAX6FD69_IRIPA|nr:uncharacterized protein M6B38_141840 [Iris pallida]